MNDKHVPARFTLNLRGGAARGPGVPDPEIEAEYYVGVLPRRAIAYFIDLFVLALLYIAALAIGFVIKIATFFILAPLVAILLPFVGIAYHVFTVGSVGAATPGMRLMGLQVRSLDGTSPTRLHAFVQIVLFYLTVPTTGGLILLFVLIDRYHRTLHDFLSQTVMLRRVPQGTATGFRVSA